MCALQDRERIRALLLQDPIWSVYALGDLHPELFPLCTWLQSALGSTDLTLLMRGFDTPILWSASTPEEFRVVFESITFESIGDPALLLQIRPELLPVVAVRYRITRNLHMLRMGLDPRAFRPYKGVARRLDPHDLEAVTALYADGAATGESPDFFFPAMLNDGVFFGIEDQQGRLAAVAGTHLVNYEEGAAAIGNVYTRRDARGRGMASLTTSCVVEHLLASAVRIVALNVKQQNTAAIRAYERLGFAAHCEFIEGTAVK